MKEQKQELPKQNDDVEKLAEEFYHRFVRYEWEKISDTMKKSILKAIIESLKQPK